MLNQPPPPSSPFESPIRLPRRGARVILTLVLTALGASLLPGCGDGAGATENRTAATPASTPAAPATPTSETAGAAPVPTSAPPRPAPRPAGPALPPSAGGPKLVFEETKHDFGLITDSEKYKASFKFVNGGTTRLVISDVKAACGCTVPTLSKRQFEPGESSRLEVVFDPKGKQGKTDKNIRVMSNDPNQPVTTLFITSTIKPLVQFERVQRLGDMKLHEQNRRIIPLLYTDPDLEFSAFEVNVPHFSARLLEKGIVESTAADGVTYRADVEVTVDPERPWGVLFATNVSFTATGRWRSNAKVISYEYKIYLLGNVFGEIHGKPTLVTFSQVKPNSRFERAMTLFRPSAEPFTVEATRVIESNLAGISIRAEPAGPAQWRVILSGETGNHRGSIKGRIGIRTSVVEEGVLEVPFSGFVQP